MNSNMHSPFFIVTNFEIWVYKEIKIHFLLETLGLAQMIPFHTTIDLFLKSVTNLSWCSSAECK